MGLEAATCGEDPPDNIAPVVNPERLTNGSRWIEIGERSRRVPFHCVEHAACVEGPADRRAVAVDRLREAGVAAKVVKGLHASIGVPNEGSRADEIVSKRESHDRAVLIDPICQCRSKTGKRAEKSDLVIGAPAYGRSCLVSFVPTHGNTGIVDCTRLTGERVARYGERLHGVGVVAARG